MNGPPALGQLERELAYYRRECNDLGARLLRLQEEQSQAFREARRSRTVAKLIREANRLADTSLAPADLGGPVLEVVVENAMCDRAALLRQEPAGGGRFAATHAVGFGEEVPGEATIPDPPAFFFTTSQTRIEPPAYELAGILRLPYVLWAYDRATGCALVLGNRSEANVSRAFEPGDQELVEGALSVYLDVLARRTAEESLREAKEAADVARREAEEARAAAEEAALAKADFLAAMSHEIRTPMTAVLGMADLLAMDRLPTSEAGYVHAIQTSGRHLLSIINDILDFSQIEAGRLTLEQVDFSVNELFEQVRSLFTSQATERGLTLVLAVNEHCPPVVRGDPTRLRQVFLNLVGNALKFTSHGRVNVRALCLEIGEGRARLRFEVEDTGIGMTTEQQAGLFQPFVQAERSTARRFGGSGLGLAICKRLVEAMDGSIGVESEHGSGSTFWVEVPLALGDIVNVQENAAVPAVVVPLRILVVEDVPLNRDLLRTMLGRRGHAVSLAENGEEAVAQAGQALFDLILMDVQMPVMDGIEATKHIRRFTAPAGRVPIVGLTANVMAAEHERCLRAGMDRVLTKPVAWPQLFNALAEMANRRDDRIAAR